MIEIESPPAAINNLPPVEVFTLNESWKDVTDPFGHLPKIEPNALYNPLTGNLVNTDNIGRHNKLTTLSKLHNSANQATTTECLEGEMGDGIPDCTLVENDNGSITLRLKKDWGIRNYGKICDVSIPEGSEDDLHDSCLSYLRKRTIADPVRTEWSPRPGGKVHTFNFQDFLRNPENPSNLKDVTILFPSVQNPDQKHAVHISQFIEGFLKAAEYQDATDLNDVWENAKICVPLALFFVSLYLASRRVMKKADKSLS